MSSKETPFELNNNFILGSHYETIDYFMNKMIHFLASNKIYYKVFKRNSSMVVLKCKDKNCTFVVRLVYSLSYCTFVLKEITINHNCNMVNILNTRNICSTIIKKNDISQIDIKTIQKEAFRSYNINISYHTARAALVSEKIKKKIILEDSYEYLKSLVNIINKNKSFAELELTQNNQLKKILYDL